MPLLLGSLTVGGQDLIDDRQELGNLRFGPRLGLAIAGWLVIREDFSSVCQPTRYSTHASRRLNSFVNTRRRISVHTSISDRTPEPPWGAGKDCGESPHLPDFQETLAGAPPNSTAATLPPRRYFGTPSTDRRLAEITRATPQFAAALRAYRAAQRANDHATAEGLSRLAGRATSCRGIGKKSCGDQGGRGSLRRPEFPPWTTADPERLRLFRAGACTR